MRTKHRNDYNNGKDGWVSGNPRYRGKGHHKGDRATTKDQTRQELEEHVRTITLSKGLKGEDEEYSGADKEKALNKLRTALKHATDDELDGIEINVAYKETRRLFRATAEEVCEGDPSIVEGQWCVEANENGCIEFRPFISRAIAVTYFMRCCGEKGEHWD
jgi:hypothetical protein